jgi:hypothetical protein
VLADAYIHDLGENESQVGVLVDLPTNPARYAIDDTTQLVSQIHDDDSSHPGINDRSAGLAGVRIGVIDPVDKVRTRYLRAERRVEYGNRYITLSEDDMTRARFGPWILGVVVLVLFVPRSVSAIGPAFIVLHGGGLQTPVVVRPKTGDFVFMWGGGVPHYDTQQPAPPTGLDGRRYLEYDVFWGRFEPEELKPEAASQHGRLYLPTANQPAAVVLTNPNMTSHDPGATRAEATPIPAQLKDFVFGRMLRPSETAALVAAGVPIN